MAEQNSSLEQRDRQKGSKLEYAYVVPDAIALYPILGSLLRALGRGWRVLVVAPTLQHGEFLNLRQKLRQPAQLEVLNLDQLNQQPPDLACNLVVSLYSDAHHNNLVRNHPQILGHTHVMTVDQQPDPHEYDLISDFVQQPLHERGVLAVVGTGKGKTTTALGMAADGFLHGGKVAAVQWFKEKKSVAKTWSIGEHNFPALLAEPDQFEFYPTGAGFVGSPDLDRITDEAEHIQKAKEGVALATQLIKSGEYLVVVLDELVDTLQEVMPYLPNSLLEVAEVQELLSLARKSDTQVIVTGRQITPSWEKYVAEAITITEKKHPWSAKHQGATPGLDF